MAHSSDPHGQSSSSGHSDDEEHPEDGTLELIRRYLAKKLGLSSDEEDEPTAEKVLDEPTLEGVANHIKSGKCKTLITLAGAGISTSAGIPDFRSPGSGLYHNLQKYNLPDPQAIFEIGFFKENPKPFFCLAKELFPGSFKPTVCHYFVRLLHEKGLLLRHYTQNIDTLERVAGIPGEKLVEAHGTFHTSHCLECRHEYTLSWMKDKIFKEEIPVCEHCPGVVKPDIVFFGENLPTSFYTNSSTDFKKCDLLIVMGSSLAVQPFASLVDRVPNTCPRLLINREKAGQKDRFMMLMGLGGGMDFDGIDSRDVAWLGDCDEGCQLLADFLGWGEELKKLVEEEHKKLDSTDKVDEATGIKEVPQKHKESK